MVQKKLLFFTVRAIKLKEYYARLIEYLIKSLTEIEGVDCLVGPVGLNDGGEDSVFGIRKTSVEKRKQTNVSQPLTLGVHKLFCWRPLQLLATLMTSCDRLLM
jgi:hypothetical protein